MSGYPQQPNQQPNQMPQQPMMYPPQQQHQMMIPSQQMNQPNQMSYPLTGLGQPNNAFMHNQLLSTNPAPPGMNPQQYSSLAGTFQARPPYNMGAAQGMPSIGGPRSIPQPASNNPLSAPQQGPGSVPGHGPLSVPQQGPGSVPGFGPLSVPGPGSVQGPMSHQGPDSVPGQSSISITYTGPGALLVQTLPVTQPTSVSGAPGPVSAPSSVDAMGGPRSVTGPSGGLQGPSLASLGVPPQVTHMGAMGQGRSPLLQGPSPSSVIHQGASPSLNNPLSHGGPQSLSSGLNPSTPHEGTRQPIKVEETPYDGMPLDDPMRLSKQLILKDLRYSFSEMSNSMGQLLRNRDNLTPEQSEKYTRDYNEFMAVCDQVEQSLTTVMETSKMLSKLDRAYTPDGGIQTGRSIEYSTQSLVNYVEDTNAMTTNVENAVAGVFDMMSMIRKREALYKTKNGP